MFSTLVGASAARERTLETRRVNQEIAAELDKASREVEAAIERGDFRVSLKSEALGVLDSALRRRFLAEVERLGYSVIATAGTGTLVLSWDGK